MRNVAQKRGIFRNQEKSSLISTNNGKRNNVITATQKE
jgi:hypothetical protein